MTKSVLYEVCNEVATITLNEPESMNALSVSMRGELRRCFMAAEKDPAVRVVVLTGTGDRAFCAGINLKQMANFEVGTMDFDFMPMVGRNIRFTKILIAAVNGYALGGGFLLAQLADIVLASNNARFGAPEGLVGRGAPWSVPLARMIPRRIWTELVTTGNPITAERAYEIGLVNRVVDSEQLEAATKEMIGSILRCAPLTIDATIKMIRMSSEMGQTAAWDAADALFDRVYRSADALEGPKAFKEGRPPNWRGS